MRILFISPIVGNPGKETVRRLLPQLKLQERIDFVIANGECAGKDGDGIKPEDVQELISIGINCITSGEQVWRKKEIIKFLESNPHTLLRPLNYPPGVPGLGSVIYNQKIGVINLLGRSFLANIDCPFRTGMTEIERLRLTTPMIIIDFHAQTTAEKQAFAWWVNGKIAAVLGTHTRVQTADERILPGGTAYITDVGMTGVYDAIGGMSKELYIEYFLKGIPIELEPAAGEVKLNTVLLELDDQTGKTTKIQRICY